MRHSFSDHSFSDHSFSFGLSCQKTAVFSRMLCIAFFLIVSLSCGQVWASGFYLPGRGVHALGRAGASIAGGDTLQTLWYNPANLVEFKGLSTLFDVGTIFTNATFKRATEVGVDGTNITFQPVKNEGMPLPDPSIILSYHLDKPNITIAYGLYAPYATNLKFPDTGSQRYALVDLSGSLFLINHLAVAWSPHPRFRIGAGFQAYTAIVRLITAASAYIGTFGAPEDRDLDLYTQASITAPFAPSGNVGLWGRVIDTNSFKLDVAASLQLPALLNANGKIKVRLPTHALFTPTSMSGERIKTSLNFPLIGRGAIRASFANRADIEVAFVYEGWSVFKQIGLTPTDNIVVKNVPTIGDYKIPSMVIPRNFVDTFSIRVGGSVKILSWLEARAGYTFEKGAIPDKTFSVFLVDSDKHLLAAGVSFRFGKHVIDLSYGIYLFQRRRITNSEVKQINPLNPEGASIIGNGTYKSMVHILGVGWRGQF